MDLANIKKLMNKQVHFNGTPYILNGLIIRKARFDFYYQVELKDMKAKSSLLIVPADDIDF